jgi:glycosyltransferase involved in cell wall biosynthesis
MEPAIIAVSQATKNDVIKLSKLQNIYVVPEGFDESVHYHEEDPEVLTALGIYKTYILYCGALDMRKNIIRILDAFDNIAKEFPEINLVLAGKADANATPMLQKLENHKYKERIITPGFVSDEQKRALMSGATVFLFPSLYEGFGLPVLEAMACGCPVITAGNTSLPEVGGDAVIYIDANNTEQLAYEIERIITSESLRDELRQKGFKQSKMFSWDKAARMTEEVYAAI